MTSTFALRSGREVTLPDIENKAHLIAPAQGVDLIRQECPDSKWAGNDDSDRFHAEAFERADEERHSDLHGYGMGIPEFPFHPRCRVNNPSGQCVDARFSKREAWQFAKSPSSEPRQAFGYPDDSGGTCRARPR